MSAGIHFRGKIWLQGASGLHTVSFIRPAPARNEQTGWSPGFSRKGPAEAGTPTQVLNPGRCVGRSRMGNSVRVKLSVMMFLEFFIWGAWFPLIFGYLPSLGFGPWEQWLILGTFNLAAVVALFFSTQFADRNFAAEKFVAFSHLVGGLAILALFWVRKPATEDSASFWLFFSLMLIHCLFYVPTISITNSIAFANLKDPQREFGPVRLWGT